MEAVFDDDYDIQDDGANYGAMKEYMKALMKRYMMEDSSTQ
jgi:hypothetical protein